MGDELGLRNDTGYAADPAHAADNRWMHRPRMDWDAAARRDDPATVEGRLFAGIQALIAARRERPVLHAGGAVEPFDTGNPHVFGYRRDLDDHRFTALANFSELEAAVRSGRRGRTRRRPTRRGGRATTSSSSRTAPPGSDDRFRGPRNRSSTNGRFAASSAAGRRSAAPCAGCARRG